MLGIPIAVAVSMFRWVHLMFYPLLVAQAVATRRRAPTLPEAEGEREGRVGEGDRLALLIVGDSSAAGVGVALVPALTVATLPEGVVLAQTGAAEFRIEIGAPLVGRVGKSF